MVDLFIIMADLVIIVIMVDLLIIIILIHCKVIIKLIVIILYNLNKKVIIVVHRFNY